MFSSEFCEISKSTYFTEHLRTTASGVFATDQTKYPPMVKAMRLHILDYFHILDYKQSITMGDEKQRFEDVPKITKYLLGALQMPLSVSYLNTLFDGRLQRKFAITETFMKAFKDDFEFLVIGDDIKIKLKGDPVKQLNEMYHEKANELRKILEKDTRRISTIKKNMLKEERTMPFEKFCKEFSSNKQKVDIAFINRNSHKLKLKALNGETYVELVEDNDFVMSEAEFWKFMGEPERLENLVLQVILSFFGKFYCSLDIGKLQACFNYGSVVIDRTFMRQHAHYFEKVDPVKMTTFKLKEEFRAIKESSLAVTETQIQNNENVILRPMPENELNEIKKKESENGVSLNVNDEDFSDTGKQTDSNSNSDSGDETDDELCSNFDLTSEAEDSCKDEDEALEDQDVTVNKSKKSLLRINERKARGNEIVGVLYPDGRKEKMENTEKSDITDGAVELDEDGSTKKLRKVIKEAIKDKRSIIIFSEDNSEPSLVDFSADISERRKQLGKIEQFILAEMCEEQL